MIKKTPWLERQFAFDLPQSMYPNLLERLRGTPARLEDRLRGVARERLTRRVDDTWSIQEIVGHLIQVEDLWAGRVDDFQAGLEALRPAAYEKGRVEGARFNERSMEDLLSEFRKKRLILVGRLESLDEATIVRVAHHPRLDRPMRVLDSMVFTADHDDHHLARITEILGATGGSTS